MAINNKALKYEVLSQELGSWHSELMKEKLYPKAYRELKNSGKWYRPEIWYDAKRIGGAFFDERLKRDGSSDKPYGIILFTRSTSRITNSLDVLFEEVMHAMLHRHFTFIKKRTVNLLYEEIAMRVLQAYAKVYHPGEYTDYYMKGYMSNAAVQSYFTALENGKSYAELDKSTRDQYLVAFNKLKDSVWRQNIGNKYGNDFKNKNKKSSVSPQRIEDFIEYMIN